MTDVFGHQARSLGDPATTVFDIIPDDNTDLSRVTTALSVATPGTVRLTTADGTTADLTIHPGQPFWIRALRVWDTGTTATGIKGLV